VVDPAGHVVGVVTEADLLAREEYPMNRAATRCCRYLGRAAGGRLPPAPPASSCPPLRSP
jgi:hypothetical protein